MKIGIDLGGTNMRVGLVDNGKIIKSVIRPCPSKESENIVVEQLIDQIKSVINPNVSSIGVGVPSVVDVKTGIVYNVANIPSWKEVHLKEILEKVFNIPVAVNNDANCFALGAKEFGASKNFKDVVGITLGTGVGAGIIINNKLFNGANTGAGEIGSLPYLDSDFESHCSSAFFTREYGVSGKEASLMMTNGDNKASIIWSHFGKNMGELIKAVLFAYDPEAIILGGSISNAYKYFENEMWNSIKTFPYQNIVNNIKIYVNDVEDVAILGASELI